MGLWARYWDGWKVEPERAVLFRFVFFGLLALETFQEVLHAPRYGAGGFNVAHFPELTGWMPLPDRYVMTVLWLALSMLSLRVAFGIAGRLTVPLITALYGYTYFVSQLDSYQHHYMVFLVLLVLSWVRWDDEEPIGWPFRLLLVQVGIVYFWTAYTKVDPLWLDGSLLSRQVPDPGFRDAIDALAGTFGLESITLWKLGAWMALAAEAFLAAALLSGRLRGIACIVGVSLHVGIHLGGFQIGLFSFYMIGFYLLVMPESWWRPVGRVVRGLTPPAPEPNGNGSWMWLVGGLVLGGAALFSIPLEAIAWSVLTLTLLAIADEFPERPGRTRRAVVYVVAAGALVMAHQSTDVVFDYYRYLGGDTRRRGLLDDAVMAYEKVVELDPTYTSGYLRLGDLYRLQNNPKRAAAVYKEATRIRPSDATSWSRLALAQDELGYGVEALESAERALARDDDNPTALRLKEKWSGDAPSTATDENP